MSLPTLILDRPKSKGESFVEGLVGTAVPGIQQSIADMIGGYNTKKQASSLADIFGLEGEEKESFVNLPSEYQKLYLQEANKKAGQLDKFTEKADTYLDRESKRLGLNLLPKQKKELRDKMKQAFLTGSAGNAPEAFDIAYEAFKTPRKEGAVSASEIGDFGQRREEWKDILSGRNETIQEKFKGLIPEFKGKEGTLREKFARTKAVAENPLATAQGLMTGATSFAKGDAEALGKVAAGLGLTIDQNKAGFLMQNEEEILKKFSPSERKSYEKGKKLGRIAVDVAMAADLAKLGVKLASKGLRRFGPRIMKNLRKYATRSGKDAQTAVADLVQGAENAGIDINAVSENPKEAQKLYNFSRQLGSPTEMRTAKAAEEIPSPRKEQELFEAKTKREKPLRKKVEAEEARKAESRARREAGKEQPAKRRVREESSKELPKNRDLYQRAISEYRQAQDAFAKNPSPRNAAKLREKSKTLEQAEEIYQNTLSEARTGEKRATDQQLQTAAKNKITDIQEAIKEKGSYNLNRKEYNPKFISESKKFGRMKEIPGDVQPNYFDKVHSAYEKAYQNRLDQIGKEISRLRKEGSMSSLKEIRNLQKEREVLNKLLEHEQAAQRVNQGRKQLQELGKARKAKEKVASAKELGLNATPQTEKIYRQSEKLFKGTTQSKSKSAENLAKEAFTQNPKQAREAVNATEKTPKNEVERRLKQKIARYARYITAKTQRFMRKNFPGSKKGMIHQSREAFFKDWKDFFKAIENDAKFSDLRKTEVGKQIILNGIVSAIQDVSGKGTIEIGDKRIPLGSAALLLTNRNRFMSAFLQGLYGLFTLGRTEVRKSQLKKAIQSGNLEKQRKLRDKLGKKKSQRVFEELVSS